MALAATSLRGDAVVVEAHGELGRGEAAPLLRTIQLALGRPAVRVIVDLGAVPHLHYDVARTLVATMEHEHRLRLVGASPYVGAILRFAGALDGDWGDLTGGGPPGEGATA